MQQLFDAQMSIPYNVCLTWLAICPMLLRKRTGPSRSLMPATKLKDVSVKNPINQVTQYIFLDARASALKSMFYECDLFSWPHTHIQTHVFIAVCWRTRQPMPTTKSWLWYLGLWLLMTGWTFGMEYLGAARIRCKSVDFRVIRLFQKLQQVFCLCWHWWWYTVCTSQEIMNDNEPSKGTNAWSASSHKVFYIYILTAYLVYTNIRCWD